MKIVTKLTNNFSLCAWRKKTVKENMFISRATNITYVCSIIPCFVIFSPCAYNNKNYKSTENNK